MISGIKRKLYLDPNLHLIFGITAIAVMGVANLTPAFPKIISELHIAPSAIGLLITAFTLPGVILTPVMGVLADRWGRKKILLPSLLLSGIAGTTCFWVRNYDLLLLLRVFQGMSAAALGSLNLTLISLCFILGDLNTAFWAGAGIALVVLLILNSGKYLSTANESR